MDAQFDLLHQRLAMLRQPFPPNQISTLPRKTKTGGIIHLSYVGHAALTDRLLDVDPAWSWEPLSMSPDGLPVMDSLGGMWIKLTVCGVTRIGYGHAGDKTGGDAIKEVIGDALRNAAMRFGCALDLWHKGDLHAHLESDEVKDERISPAKESAKAASEVITADRKAELDEMALYMVDCHKDGKDMDAIRLWYDAETFADNEERTYVWSLLATESKLRSAIKANKPEKAAA